MQEENVYDSARMAAGYAFSRPPVHASIVARIREDLRIETPAARALDVGCGAGRSTAALEPIARSAVGLELVPAMLAHRRAVAPRASFVVARAEQLPFAAGSFDVVTAAGSLNYVDLGRFLPEVSRVLTAGGVLVIYDFSAGRRLRGSGGLDGWYEAFERRFPPKPGYEMDVKTLGYAAAGLRLASYAEFEVAVPMTRQSYVDYVMSETGVALAVARGVPESGVRDWCETTLAGVLAEGPRDVLFDAYVAYVSRAASSPWPDVPGLAGTTDFEPGLPPAARVFRPGGEP